MKRTIVFAILCTYCAYFNTLTWASPQASVDEKMAEAKRSGWKMATKVVKSLEEGDQKDFPGIQAWLNDFHKQIKGIDEKTAPDDWPKFDVNALVTRNPRFWQMCYEVAPADPGMGLLHGGLLMVGGETKRAYHVLQLSQNRPNMPDDVLAIFDRFMSWALAGGEVSNAIVNDGIKLHDAKDYDGAIEKYREAIEAWPQNGLAYYELGFSIRTKLQIADGLAPEPNGLHFYNAEDAKKAKAWAGAPEVVEAFAKARLHDPFQLNAYQGLDPAVNRGFFVMKEKVWPAIEELYAQTEIPQKYKILVRISEGYQEANQHELALVARQSLVAFRGRYDPTDHPFITKSLRALAPGNETETTLKRLSGSAELALRQLIPTENSQLFLPDSPEDDASKKVVVEHIQIISNEKEFLARVETDNFLAFIKQAEKVIFADLDKAAHEFKVKVHFKCTPTGHEVTVYVNEEHDENEAILKTLQSNLSKMEKLLVKEQTVEFGFLVVVNRQ
jgi:tetratricopeptide (TPR) repeat protein